jgi:hypothetical protein
MLVKTKLNSTSNLVSLLRNIDTLFGAKSLENNSTKRGWFFFPEKMKKG